MYVKSLSIQKWLHSWTNQSFWWRHELNIALECENVVALGLCIYDHKVSLILFLCELLLFQSYIYVCPYIVQYFMLRPQHNYLLNIHSNTHLHTKTCITYSHLCTLFMYIVVHIKINLILFCWLLLHLLLFLYMCGFFHSWQNAHTMIDVKLFFSSGSLVEKLNLTQVQLQPSSTYYLDDCHPSPKPMMICKNMHYTWMHVWK